MSTQPIPVFDPQGVLRDVPEDQLQAAVKAGGMPAVRFQTPEKNPDGSPKIRYVPANRTQEAVQAGGKLLPFEQQDVKHPGFWLTLDDAINKPITVGGEEDRALTHAKDLAVNMARNLGDISALNIGTQTYRNLTGQPNTLKELPEKIVETGVPMMLGDEAPATARPPVTAADTAPREATTASSGFVDRALEVAKRRALHLIPGVQSVRDLDYLLRGNPEAAPATPSAPAPAVPDWYGKGSFGTPVGMWGQRIAPPAEIPARMEPGAAGSMAESVAAPSAVPQPMSETPSGAGIPRTLSGDSALRQILTGQDNANLMKIARSRGINVSTEAQLKPSAADPRLINKIIDDFSDEELDSLRSFYIENTRMGRHDFGDIGAEANKTLAMQTYFPDVKIPASQMIRTRAAILNAPLRNVQPVASPVEDLTAILKESLKQAAKKKAGQAGAITESVANQ